MKNVVVLHDAGETVNSYWYPWLQTKCEQAGINFWLRELPNAERPELNECMNFVMALAPIDEETIFVGHSSGCPLILSILEQLHFKVKKAILVAGFAEVLGADCPPMVQLDYDWQKIKNNCKEFVLFNSPDDPWGCTDEIGRHMLAKLGGTMIVRYDGHYGSDKYNQPYPEFPQLWKMIKETK